jgi:ribulose-5-phosphate 4-epimerase/fuculose-1-phosphate aldolase
MTGAAMDKSMPAPQLPDPRGIKVRDRVSAAEWNARIELAALYRLAAHFRMTDTIYTHISMRVPDEFAFLINPFGLLYEEITASSLVKVDVEGNVLDDPTGIGINRAGFVIHGAIHQARHDVACVMHTHTPAGVGVAAQKDGLLPISQHAAILVGSIGYHDFEGIAVDRDEQRRLIEDLGPHPVLILRNHGLLTVGRTAMEALYYMLVLERACQIQIAAQSGGAALRVISKASIVATEAVIKSAELNLTRDWGAMMRLVERIAPDYAA